MNYYEKIIQEKWNSSRTAEEVKSELNRYGWWEDIQEFKDDARSAGYRVIDEGSDWVGLLKDGQKWHVRISGTERTKKVTSVSAY